MARRKRNASKKIQKAAASSDIPDPGPLHEIEASNMSNTINRLPVANSSNVFNLSGSMPSEEVTETPRTLEVHHTESQVPCQPRASGSTTTHNVRLIIREAERKGKENAQKICNDFRRGRCQRRKCRERIDSGNKNPIPASRAVSPTACPQRQTNGTHASIPDPPDCTFCILGLCGLRNEHCSASSLIVPSLTPAEPLPSQSNPGQYIQSLPEEATCTGSNKGEQVTRPRFDRGVACKISEPEKLTITLRKTMQVTFGPGIHVQNIITGFESSYVLLGNLPHDIIEDHIRHIASPYGNVLKVQIMSGEGPNIGTRCNSNKRVVKVQYADPNQAACAVAGLNGEYYCSSKITAKLDYFKGTRTVGRLHSSLVRMELPVPGRVAYAGYATKAEADRIVAAVHGTAPSKGPDRKGMFSPIFAQLHTGSPKLGNFTVRFEGLPPDMTEHQITTIGGGKAEGIMVERLKYHSLSTAVSVLRRIMEEHGNVISVDPPTSPPVDGRVRCLVLFANPVGAAAACAELNGRSFAFLSRERIWLDHLYTIMYIVSSDIYRAVEQELRDLQAYAKTIPGVHIAISKRPGVPEYKIELSGTDLPLTKKAKAPLERVITGERLVDDNGKPVYDSFFSSFVGTEFINNTSQITGAHISVNGARGETTVWGTSSSRANARKRIDAELARLNARRCYALPLTPKAFSQLMNESLANIEAHVNKENVFVNFAKRNLTIRGTESQFKWVVQYLNGHNTVLRASRTQVSRGGSHKNVAKSCPVCLDFLIDSVTLDCGHQTCRGCLRRYLETACEHKMFPLRCLGSEGTCEELLPLKVCRGLSTKDQFNSILESSFVAHIQSRPDEYFYCPTPDCTQIYRLAGPSRSELQCPDCLVCICPTCHKEQHEGEECGETGENDRLFREWKGEHGVKQCPRCTSELQKVDGCNHITCIRCSTHICWKCMMTFQNASDVYEHMNTKHNGQYY